MKYEAAFRAFEAKDYARAAELLEPSVYEAGLTSDILNHTFTLALFHSGQSTRLADAAFDIGQELLASDPASALDYFERALYAGLDPERSRQIGAIFEGWSQAPSPGSPQGQFQGQLQRIAHVVGSLSPSQVSIYVGDLCRSLADVDVESCVFTTENHSAWFFSPTGPNEHSVVRIESEVRVASLEGDFFERADRIASEISEFGSDIVLYHSDLGEQITTRVAALRPAPLQVNVNHDVEMDADLFDGAVHLFRDGLEGTRFEDRLSRWIPPVSDVQSRLDAAGFPDTRPGDLGDFKTVSATFGEGRTGSDQEYLEAIVAILRRSPAHMHMFVGPGDRRSARSYLHSCDVLRQVRFIGQSTDAVTYLPMIDVYIASFPDADAQSIIEAMARENPLLSGATHRVRGTTAVRSLRGSRRWLRRISESS